VFADAARAVDANLAEEIEREGNWRKNYLHHVRALVEAGAASSKDALRIASDGLASLHDNLVFARDGEETSIDGAYESYRAPSFATTTLAGTGGGHRKLVVPYRNDLLSDDSLRAQLDRWEADSIIEPSCAEAVRAVIDNPEWLDLSDQNIALLGAASEMGPLEALSSWGANIIAIDVPRPHVWQRILTIARAGSGNLHVPTKTSGVTEDTIDREAGADLLTNGPEVRTWLESFEGPLTVMDLVYSDGGNFVRLVASIDGLVTSLLERRKDVALAYLGTPTDVYAVPAGTANAGRAKARTGPLRALVRGAARGHAYTARYGNLINSEEGLAWGISDCIVPQQGPNYILAKNSQRWRACTAREEGIVTSANVAPATYTQSVVKNRLLKMAYGGAHAFGVQVFLPGTSRALMAALLVHDLRNPRSIAQPSASLRHPFELHATGAAHGGIWTIPYEPRSVLPLAVVRGLPKIAMR
jgi:hypothetical protein